MRLFHNSCQQHITYKNEIFAATGSGRDMQNRHMQESDARIAIANWLKEALNETHVSQTELGRRINLDQSKISRIIKRDRAMSATELLAAASALKVPLPSIEPGSVAMHSAEAVADPDLEPDLSELALMITKDLEQKDFDGNMPPDNYIDTSAIIYTMLKTVGTWHPDLWQAAHKMMKQVKHDKQLTSITYRDYIKSIVVYYKTFVEAELENH